MQCNEIGIGEHLNVESYEVSCLAHARREQLYDVLVLLHQLHQHLRERDLALVIYYLLIRIQARFAHSYTLYIEHA